MERFKSKIEEERKISFPEALKRYIMVELQCDMTQCKPCSFPDCPLLEKSEKDLEHETKTVELSKALDKDLEENIIKRYLMVETSCDGTACDPCTYPNCQRFSRDMKLEMREKFKKPKVRRIFSIDREGNVIE